MSETFLSAEPAPAAPTAGADAGWQPLPTRARPLFALSTALPLAIPAVAVGFFIFQIFDLALPILGASIGGLLGLGLGAWLGLKQFNRVAWRLDDEGLAIRRGRLWQRETRVPATRVQHLDLKRGPWQRRRNLATLVVHTAGTRHSAVTVPHLDADDAERLRDRLSRQIDHDDDA